MRPHGSPITLEQRRRRAAASTASGWGSWSRCSRTSGPRNGGTVSPYEAAPRSTFRRLHRRLRRPRVDAVLPGSQHREDPALRSELCDGNRIGDFRAGIRPIEGLRCTRFPATCPSTSACSPEPSPPTDNLTSPLASGSIGLRRLLFDSLVGCRKDKR